MTDWLELDVDRLNKRQREVADGPEIAASPYDIPDAVRLVSSPGNIEIEFRFLGTDVTKSQKQSTAVTLHIGRNSGRIFRINVSGKNAAAAIADAQKTVHILHQDHTKMRAHFDAILAALKFLADNSKQKSRSSSAQT